MKIVNKRLSLNDFEEYVAKKDFGKQPPTFLVMHHTFSPIEDDKDGKLEAGEWNGQKTVDGLKRYYEGKGWAAGPHLFIADDGIWLFTDMYDVGIHAGMGNGDIHNGYSIGIEVVGNYDDKVWDEETYTNTIGAIKILMAKLNISEGKIMFHRDYSSKTCPGKAISKEWVIKQLKEEIMEKEFVTALEKLAGKNYGDNLNSKEQKNAAEKIEEYREEAEKNLDEKVTALGELNAANSIIEIRDAQIRQDAETIKFQGDKIAEYDNMLIDQNLKMEDKNIQIANLEAGQQNGVAALGTIKLFQEAFKALINFK